MQEVVPVFNPSIETSPYMPPSGDWQIMKDTSPDAIQAQIEAGMQVYGGPASFLNNLADNLPGGRRRDERLAERYPDKFGPDAHRHNPDQWNDWQKGAHSDRMAHATYGEFHSDIEAAIADAAQDPSSGITRENLVALNTARSARQFARQPGKYALLLDGPAREAYAREFDGNLEEAFAQYLLPVYARLRAMGYSHYDLFQ